MAQPPDFSIEAVAAAVTNHFGLEGSYQPLVSERDQNFCLETADGLRFVVKVTGLHEPRNATDFQIAILEHRAGSGYDRAPSVIRTTAGKSRSAIVSDSGQEHSLRVVTWLTGELLHDSGTGRSTVARFGHRLAELDQALQSFRFDGNGEAGLWNLQCCLLLRDFLPHIVDDNVRQHCSAALTFFGDKVLPKLRELPQQAIHNDANPENVLVNAEGDVAGFIDFGDSLTAPRIVEVAIAAAYLRSNGNDPLGLIAAFVAGYQDYNPLARSELQLLFDLIKTRLAMTLIIMYWRLDARDENDPYRKKTLGNEGKAFALLAYLTELGQDRFNEALDIP